MNIDHNHTAAKKAKSYNILNDDAGDDMYDLEAMPHEDDTRNLYVMRNTAMTYMEENEKEDEYQPSFYYESSLSSNNSECDDAIHEKKIHNYRKLTFEEVEQSLNKHYYHQNKFSNEIDILITFIKGQKHVYSNSNRITKQKIWAFLGPILFISCSTAIISPIIYNRYEWSGWLITALNAIVTFGISVFNQLQLQSNQKIYNYYENHYTKLESSLVMTRNELVMMCNDEDRRKTMLNKLQEVESRMMEIKETFNIQIPFEVYIQYPIISYLNVFPFLQKIEEHRKYLIMQYKDTKNSIRYIMHKWEVDQSVPANSLQKDSERTRLKLLFEKKDKLKTELMEYHNSYSYIDDIFSREIMQADKMHHFFSFIRIFFCCRLTENVVPKFVEGPPIVNQHLNFLFRHRSV